MSSASDMTERTEAQREDSELTEGQLDIKPFIKGLRSYFNKSTSSSNTDDPLSILDAISRMHDLKEDVSEPCSGKHLSKLYACTSTTKAPLRAVIYLISRWKGHRPQLTQRADALRALHGEELLTDDEFAHEVWRTEDHTFGSAARKGGSLPSAAEEAWRDIVTKWAQEYRGNDNVGSVQSSSGWSRSSVASWAALAMMSVGVGLVCKSLFSSRGSRAE